MIAAQCSSVLRAHAKDKGNFVHYTAGELSTKKSPAGSNQDSFRAADSLDHNIFQWMMFLQMVGGGSGHL